MTKSNFHLGAGDGVRILCGKRINITTFLNHVFKNDDNDDNRVVK